VVESEEVEMPIRCFVDVLKLKLARKDQSWLQEFVDSRLDGEFNHLQAVMRVDK
jgi:hypothetical protein